MVNARRVAELLAQYRRHPVDDKGRWGSCRVMVEVDTGHIQAKKPRSVHRRNARRTLPMYHHATETIATALVELYPSPNTHSAAERGAEWPVCDVTLSGETTRQNFLAADILSGLPPRKPVFDVRGKPSRRGVSGCVTGPGPAFVSGGPTPRMRPA